MVSKLVLFAISEFVLKQSQSNSAAEVAEKIKQDILAQILNISLRLLSGVLISVIVLFSAIKSMQAAQILFSQLENGVILELISFALIALSGGISMFFILRGNSNETQVLPTSMEGSEIHKIIFDFTKGLIEGYQEQKTEQKNPSPPI